MLQAETILFWLTVFAYVAAFCFQLFAFVTAKPKGLKYSNRILWIAFVLHTTTAIIRWIAGSHPPVTDTYELNLTGTWFTILVFLIFNWLSKIDRSIALVVTPVVFLILGHGYMSKTPAIPMSPAYNSPWLAVHVIFAWLSFGCYAIATASAVLFLLTKKLISWKPTIKIPDQQNLDISGYRFIVLGFINHAVMLVSGAIWAKKLWGRYWSWDALETWSLIAFLFYAFYLHARSFLGWKMKRAAWLAITGLIVVAVSFWGVDWFAPSVHPGP